MKNLCTEASIHVHSFSMLQSINYPAENADRRTSHVLSPHLHLCRRRSSRPGNSPTQTSAGSSLCVARWSPSRLYIPRAPSMYAPFLSLLASIVRHKERLSYLISSISGGAVCPKKREHPLEILLSAVPLRRQGLHRLMNVLLVHLVLFFSTIFWRTRREVLGRTRRVNSLDSGAWHHSQAIALGNTYRSAWSTSVKPDRTRLQQGLWHTSISTECFKSGSAITQEVDPVTCPRENVVTLSKACCRLQ